MTRTHALLAAAAAAALALLGWAFMPRPLEVEAAPVTRGHFETAIVEDGKTRLRAYYTVSAPLAGVLNRIALREGDVVEANAQVATLRPLAAPLQDERTLREQQARVDVTDAMVQRAAARAEAARVALERSRSDLRRSEQLAGQGYIAASKLESDRLAVRAAQKELDAAAEERHVAVHEVDQARAALLAVRNPDPLGRRSFSLHAPVGGRVLRVVQPSETVVGLGTPLLELGDLRELDVVAELLTADALQAVPGSKVLIERWGGPPLDGRVRRIEPAAFTKVSALGVEEQRVRVWIEITSPPERWRSLGDAFRVTVRIITLARDGVLKVPAAAVFPLPQADATGAARFGAFALHGGRARLRQLELGARNDSEAMLVRGLEAGTRVIVYPSAEVSDGARVTVRSVNNPAPPQAP